MQVSAARATAFDILLRMERENAYAAELLHGSRYAKLSAVDYALATELVMGVLRWRSCLDRQISEASSQTPDKLDLEVLIALRLGIYQMRYLERIPVRAAIHQAVELVKRARKQSAASFVNAVLRRVQAIPPKFYRWADAIRSVATASALGELSAHPLWLVERWIREFGLEAAKAICIHDQSVPNTVVRFREGAAEEELLGEGIELAPGKLLSRARRVLSGNVTRTKAFAERRVVIQDEASQLVALLTGRGPRLLDCCAAPGGKTSILAERNPESAITAVELHPHRARLLRRLASADNVRVIAADARNLPLAAQFERVLADVPCSGTGTLARNPDMKWRLRPGDLPDLQSRQLAILDSAMARVAVGGKLVYSTCSLENEENSDVVEKALTADTNFKLLDARAELQRLQREGELVLEDLDSILSRKYLRIIPGMHESDGFFAAILERI